jgi:hypothetical protein
MKQTITIIDENFEEKSLELTYAQLKELNRWLNIYLNTGKTIEYKKEKNSNKIVDVRLAQM